jgi:hypothetical protein
VALQLPLVICGRYVISLLFGAKGGMARAERKQCAVPREFKMQKLARLGFNWVDAVAGAKIQAALTPKLVITVLGDAGGGSARSDYQVAGLLGYKLGRKCILQAGYRYLEENYRPNGGFIYNTTTTGLLLGATIKLK